MFLPDTENKDTTQGREIRNELFLLTAYIVISTNKTLLCVKPEKDGEDTNTDK